MIQSSGCVRCSQEQNVAVFNCCGYKICSPCMEVWKKTCFDKGESANCPKCERIFALNPQKADEIQARFKEILKKLSEMAEKYD